MWYCVALYDRNEKAGKSSIKWCHRGSAPEVFFIEQMDKEATDRKKTETESKIKNNYLRFINEATSCYKMCTVR